MKAMSAVLFCIVFSSTLLFVGDRRQRALRRSQFENAQKEYVECGQKIYQQYQQCIEKNGGVINEVFFKNPCKQQAMFFTQQVRFEYQELLKEVGYTQKDYFLDKVDNFWKFLGYEL